MSLLKVLFVDANEREGKRLQPLVDRINALEKQFEGLSLDALKTAAGEIRERLAKGEGMDDVLPDAFALAREATKRTLKQRQYNVQLTGGLALHRGMIAEMRTGEGKTLTAVAPIVLNALTGKGVHLVTVNDYLARRDAVWMGQAYHALGLSVGCIQHESGFLYDPTFKREPEHDEERDATGSFRVDMDYLRPCSRREAYAADITYGTNNEFGFDYLRDNMVGRVEEMVQRELHYAIVDEVDSILIDEARTPLIISGPAAEPAELYYRFADLVPRLNENEDYKVDEKHRAATLTESGITKMEGWLNVENLYTTTGMRMVHHLEQALRAHALYKKDRDYVVKDGEVIIVDEFTGRLMIGRRYSEGLHQAIEAKEEVPIQQESQTLATISFQNYFRMYKKLAGMTGTAATEAEEFNKIYKLEVVVIPTNNPMVRADHPDTIYKTQDAKYKAVANLVGDLHEKGQPVLVGTTSIEKNEFLSELLKRKGISHALLNAKNHEKEAEIISLAGGKGAVTVATNMAGRGVDIVLGKGVIELGGLYVIGTERHESRRIDNQLRGRSGRQGDQGATRFFVSLEDDLMRIFGGEQVSKVMDFLKMPEDTPIEHGLVSKAIEGAQKKVEGHNFDIRKHTVEYDDVMNQQRQIIYEIRKKVLETAERVQGSSASQKKDTSLKDELLEKIERELGNIVTIYSEEGINSKKIVEE